MHIHPSQAGRSIPIVARPARPRRPIGGRVNATSVLVGAACSLLVGCGGGGGTTPRVVPTPPIAFSPQDLLTDVHTLAAGDVLAINFPFRPALNQDVLVRDDGRVTFPLIGTMRAAGETPEALQRMARESYEALGTGYTPDEKAYRLAAGDVLEVRFERAPELNVTLPIRPDGRVTLEHARDLLAEGRTPGELEAALRTAYSDYLTDPSVAVIVRQVAVDRAFVGNRAVGLWAAEMAEVGVAVRSSAVRQIYVVGEVRSPGFQTYRAPMTLMQAVASAGGPIRSGRMSEVLVLRKVGTEEPTATIVDLTREMGGQFTSDIPLRPYDIVVIPKTRIARVNDFLDQYLYQLIPATRNVNFTYFYDFHR